MKGTPAEAAVRRRLRPLNAQIDDLSGRMHNLRQRTTYSTKRGFPSVLEWIVATTRSGGSCPVMARIIAATSPLASRPRLIG